MVRTWNSFVYKQHMADPALVLADWLKMPPAHKICHELRRYQMLNVQTNFSFLSSGLTFLSVVAQSVTGRGLKQGLLSGARLYQRLTWDTLNNSEFFEWEGRRAHWKYLVFQEEVCLFVKEKKKIKIELFYYEIEDFRQNISSVLDMVHVLDLLCWEAALLKCISHGHYQLYPWGKNTVQTEFQKPPLLWHNSAQN